MAPFGSPTILNHPARQPQPVNHSPLFTGRIGTGSIRTWMRGTHKYVARHMDRLRKTGKLGQAAVIPPSPSTVPSALSHLRSPQSIGQSPGPIPLPSPPLPSIHPPTSTQRATRRAGDRAGAGPSSNFRSPHSPDPLLKSARAQPTAQYHRHNRLHTDTQDTQGKGGDSPFGVPPTVQKQGTFSFVSRPGSIHPSVSGSVAVAMETQGRGADERGLTHRHPSLPPFSFLLSQIGTGAVSFAAEYPLGLVSFFFLFFCRY